MEKLRIGVMFGGRSVEHDVSIITANEIISNLDTDKYDIVPIYVSREGEWYTGEKLLDLRFASQIDSIVPSLRQVFIPPIPSMKGLLTYPQRWSAFRKPTVEKLDVVIPAFHGLNGEDGTVQGLLELVDIPYVGPGVLGSAVGMDKILMKSVFKGHDFPVLNYTWFLRKDWEKDKDKILENILEQLNYPLFVKPSNLGSSIGISKAEDRQSLEDAIEVAVQYDRRIVVEEGMEKPVEINCSVCGMDDEVEVSECEQPATWEDFLSFENKYLRWSEGSGGAKGCQTSGAKSASGEGPSSIIPANIPETLTKQIQDMSVNVFKALDCKGVARIDFLLDNEDMNFYVNEINTLPGSFSHYLWTPVGVSFSQLLDKIIQVAIDDNKEKNKNMYKFDNELLEKINESLQQKEQEE